MSVLQQPPTEEHGLFALVVRWITLVTAFIQLPPSISLSSSDIEGIE